MALNKRGLRRMNVDGHAYVWRVRETKCPCCRSRSVVIADASRNGSLVLLPPPRNFEGPETAVTPSLIAAAIRTARGRGWQPGVGHGVFITLNYNYDDDVEVGATVAHSL